MLFTWDMVLYWCGRHTAIYLDIILNFNFEQCWMLTIFVWLQRCISPIYQSFSCCLQNVIITPGVNIPPIKNSSITECSCHWQVFHLLYINTFPNITYILYISIFCTLHVMIGFDFRGYSPFHSDSESHVDRGAKSNCRHRVKHINIALNGSKKIHFSVNLLIILTQERISETENQWFTVERVAFAWTGTLKTIYLGGKMTAEIERDWFLFSYNMS